MKHAKKSMFITTILMVVLMVVALSTATFAWFTSNNTVTAATTTMTAANSVSANIGIGWVRNDTGTSIIFEDATGLLPAAPTALPTDGTATANARYAVSTTVPAAGKFVPAAMPGDLDYLNIKNLAAADITNAKLFTQINIDYAVSTTGIYELVVYRNNWYPADPGSSLKEWTVVTNDTATPAADEIKISDAIAKLNVTASNSGDNLAPGDKVWEINEYEMLPAETLATARPSNCIVFPDDGSCAAGANYVYAVKVAGAINSGDILLSAVTSGYSSLMANASDKFLYQSAAEIEASNSPTTSGAFTFLSSNIDGNNRFLSNGSAPAGINNTLTQKDGAGTTFYVSNNSTSAAVTSLTMDISILGENNGLLRVAVFVEDNYVATLATGASATTYGNIVLGANYQTSMGSYPAAGASITLPGLSARQSIGIKLIAWYDGIALDAAGALKDCTFTLTFTANV